MLTFIKLSMLGSIMRYSTLLEHPEYIYAQMYWVVAKTTKFTWKGSSFFLGINPDTSIIATIMVRYGKEKLIYKRFYEKSIDIIKIL